MADALSRTPPLLSPALVRKLALGLVIGAVAYGALLLYADAPALLESVRKLSWSTLALTTALGLANYVVRLLRWELYLRKVDIRVPFVARTLVFFAGFAMSITPGKVGEALKALMLRDAFDVPLVRSSPIPIAERLTDLVGMLLLGGVASFVLEGGVFIAGACVATAVAVGVVLFWQRPREWLIDRVTSTKRLANVRVKLLAAHDALSDLVTPSTFAAGTLLSMLAWSLHGLSLAAAASGFPDVDLSVMESMVAYSAPILAGALALIPGGLGLTEASMVGFVQHLGGPGATPEVAGAITLVVRLVTFWFAIALGFIALALWRRIRVAS